MIHEGYEIKSSTEFNINMKHILIVGSNQSVYVQSSFAVTNYGTNEFTPEMDNLFSSCRLGGIG
eukprot:3427265-Ditylum_brightwellii.AAC.1